MKMTLPPMASCSASACWRRPRAARRPPPRSGRCRAVASPAVAARRTPIERGVRLAQKAQVGPCIPVGIQLQRAEVGPSSGPTRRPPHLAVPVVDAQHAGQLPLIERLRRAAPQQNLHDAGVGRAVNRRPPAMCVARPLERRRSPLWPPLEHYLGCSRIVASEKRDTEYVSESGMSECIITWYKATMRPSPSITSTSSASPREHASVSAVNAKSKSLNPL